MNFLSDTFVAPYEYVKPDWGFASGPNSLGEITYLRSYSQNNERWFETVRRVVEETYQILWQHCQVNHIPFDADLARNDAEMMYDLMFNFKFEPGGRGVYAMGTDAVRKKSSMYLFNCSFVTTENIDKDPITPFIFMLDVSMCGVGCGFDVRGAGKIVWDAQDSNETNLVVVEDSREGWCDATKTLLEWAFGLSPHLPVFDYSQIRPKGAPIATSGGVAPGPEPLMKLHAQIFEIQRNRSGEKISEKDIADIMNMIGVCVVSGGKRRTAQIMFGDAHSDEYINLKNYDLHPDRMEFGWASNNSVFAEVGMDYSRFIDRIADNGEPGFVWLDNVRRYGRMSESPNDKNWRVKGLNPCFSGDTLIAVADGRNVVSIKDLADAGEDVDVYSVNPETGKVSIERGWNPRKTGRSKLLKITFNDGSFLKVTPNHKMFLLDGSVCEASELVVGQSVPAFTKRIQQIKRGGQNYYRLNCNIFDSTKDKIFEHRLIARRADNQLWNSMYDEAKVSGWVNGGIVVHHKDYNGLNNSPSNLKILTFAEHAKLHGRKDNNGVKNGMYGKTHSDATKKLISEKIKQKMADAEWYSSWKTSRPSVSEEQRKINSEQIKARWSFWYDERGVSSFIEKVCEVCGDSFTVPYGKRERGFCSRRCANVYLSKSEKRLVNLRSARNEQAKHSLDKQIEIFLSMQIELGREPLKVEWERRCRENGVTVRFQKETPNPYIARGFNHLKELAAEKNHRIVAIEELPEEDVFNITVENNHTLAAVTKWNDKGFFGVFTFQCGEATLEDMETCNLVEVYPERHATIEEFHKTLKYALIYAKAVTLIPTHWKGTNAVSLRNRRIGIGPSGLVQFAIRRGKRELIHWLSDGYKTLKKYDTIYSEWLCIRESISLTVVKPSGTMSLLSGSTPGVHYPTYRYYIRRMRFRDDSELLAPLIEAGYKTEQAKYEPMTTIVEFPVAGDDDIPTEREVSVGEKFSIAVLLQKYWADQSVSATITFDKDKDKQSVVDLLSAYDVQLKSISLLPFPEQSSYEQMPYEAITKDEYEQMISNIKPIDWGLINGHDTDIQFCDSDSCEI